MTESRAHPVERIHSEEGLEGQQHAKRPHVGEAGGRLYPTGD